MKIAVLCKSPLLQKSLELFLVDYLSSLKQCDAIVSDFSIQTDKPIIAVGNDNCEIKIPFTRAQLFMTLEARFAEKTYEQEDTQEQNIKFLTVEDEIKELTDRYKHDILQVIKKHYES